MVLVAHGGHGVDLEFDFWMGFFEGALDEFGLDYCEGGAAGADVDLLFGRYMAVFFVGEGGVQGGAGGGRLLLFVGCHVGRGLRGSGRELGGVVNVFVLLERIEA